MLRSATRFFFLARPERSLPENHCPAKSASSFDPTFAVSFGEGLTPPVVTTQVVSGFPFIEAMDVGRVVVAGSQQPRPSMILEYVRVAQVESVARIMSRQRRGNKHP
jgi:hypothetical protein